MSTAYFPPVQYISKFKEYGQITMEMMENFGKQSYRNRCRIMTANGLLDLTVPVLKANSGLPVKEMQISYATRWDRIHRRAIVSAYTSAPYYEYYIDDFLAVIEKRHRWLLDLNAEILEMVLDILHITTRAVPSTEFIREEEIASGAFPEVLDFRNTIHPKAAHAAEDPAFSAKPYRQVFSDRYPFAPNLSIMDLLFCEGPDSLHYL